MTVSMQRVSGSIVPLVMIDTGGIDDVDAPFMEQIKHQAEIAMEEAGYHRFCGATGKEGITDVRTST